MKYTPIRKNITAHPTFIVGMAPGRQRKSQQTLVMWEGNVSGDLMQRMTAPFNNLYFTNIVHEYVKGDFEPGMIQHGVKALILDIFELQPRKILCFGSFAYKHALRAIPKGLQHMYVIVKLTHPSYIQRFHKNQEEYVRMVQHELA